MRAPELSLNIDRTSDSNNNITKCLTARIRELIYGELCKRLDEMRARGKKSRY